MGAGKSSIGRRLAERTGRAFIDTDQLIVNRLGRPIDRIFELYGEQAFRDHEASIIESLEPAASVISTGGGAILRDSNWEALRTIGTTIYLRVSKDSLIDRLQVSRKKRPLLANDNWEEVFSELYDKRNPLYERCEIIVDLGDCDLEEATEKVLEVLKND